MSRARSTTPSTTYSSTSQRIQLKTPRSGPTAAGIFYDAFLLSDGSTPVDLAYAVHSDIGDGYLHAVNAKSSREVSDEYELEEGDVIKIVSTN